MVFQLSNGACSSTQDTTRPSVLCLLGWYSFSSFSFLLDSVITMIYLVPFSCKLFPFYRPYFSTLLRFPCSYRLFPSASLEEFWKTFCFCQRLVFLNYNSPNIYFIELSLPLPVSRSIFYSYFFIHCFLHLTKFVCTCKFFCPLNLISQGSN